jgi:glutamate synthase (NADPH/NADH) small chain
MATKRTIRSIPQQRTQMAEQPAAERARNFDEVNLGYSAADALRESERCLFCPDEPCIRGCPVGIDIPAFIERIGEGDARGAYEVLSATTLLPAICGRVCPQETQCEAACVVGRSLEPVAIGRLERWVGDAAITEGWASVPFIEPNQFRVAIIGSGPAGLACAADVARAGCAVTVFEAFHQVGGVLRYGIPDFRLPGAVIDAEVAKLAALGVSFRLNTLVGRLFSVEDLLTEMGFHAAFIGVGAGTPRFLEIPGESLNGVVSANELLTRVNLMRARTFPDQADTPPGVGRRVAVVGAGNTAMDAMRVCLRLGAESVSCVYRRSAVEAPARIEELHHAEAEGVAFHWLTNPVAVLDDGTGAVRGLRCERMELGEADASGRRRPATVPDSAFEIECDTVVIAIGTDANPILGQTSRLALDERGYLRADEDCATSLQGIFAGGDIVTGAATVIEAMGAGRRAAASICRYLGLAGREGPYRSGPMEATLFGIAPEQHVYESVVLG